MLDDQPRRLSGVISPKQRAEKIYEEWALQLEQNGLPPDTRLQTDGEKFAIHHRPIWPKESVMHTFKLVVGKVHNMEAQRVGLPHPSLGTPTRKADLEIKWDE